MTVTLGEVAQFVTALAVLWSTLRNGRKLDQVHKTTNSLALRNEVIARELGVAEGTAAQKAKP